MINILLLSVGTRNKIVQYFKETFKNHGLVIATDMSKLAPAIYDADRYYIVPPMNEPGYIDTVLDICKDNHITGVLSLIDPELSLLASHEKDFNDIGVTVIGSSYELCELSLDKYKMYQWLSSHGYNCAKSWLDKDSFFKAVDSGEVSFPVFVKPAKGSASLSISKVYDKETVDILYKHSEGLMIQEFLDGQEIGADVYIDIKSNEIIDIFTKKKIKMRAGETDKSVSFYDSSLYNYIERFVSEAGYKGIIDIDIFEVNGNYYISEVNPRFGGGYPHAYESGCCQSFPKCVLNNLLNVSNEPYLLSQHETDDISYMLKYNELKIII